MIDRLVDCELGVGEDWFTNLRHDRDDGGIDEDRLVGDLGGICQGGDVKDKLDQN